jgi:hypothetical protein
MKVEVLCGKIWKSVKGYSPKIVYSFYRKSIFEKSLKQGCHMPHQEHCKILL